MKKLLFFITFLSIPITLLAQVGINTTSPNAQLDIRSTSQATPFNTDGLLIPKIDNFPAINPTADQDGMLVFVTGNSVPAKGFYYWNQPTSSWVPLASGPTLDTDWYKTETTETATALTDSIFTLGNVAIGKNTATASLDILNQDNERAINVLIDGVSDNNLHGNYTQISNSGNGTHYGINSFFSGSGSGAHVGNISRFSAGSGNLTGKWTEFSGTIGNGNQLGAYNSYFAGGDGILAGSYTDIRSTVAGNGPQYGTFTTNSSPGTGFHYGHYTLLGGAGTGAQFGNYTAITNSNNSTHYGNYNVLSGVGNGTRYGVINFLTGVGNGMHYGIYNSSLASGDGTHHGSFNALGGEGNGDQYGTLNFMLNTGTGIQYGVRNDFIWEGSGTKYGTYNSMAGTGTGDQYGTYNAISNSANGTHSGVYNILSGTSATAQYGVRSEFTGNGNAQIIGSRHIIHNSGNNEHRGVFNLLGGTGSGNKYGVQNNIMNTGNGNHYGVDNTFSGPGSGFHAGIINRFTNGSGTLAGAWTEFSGNVGNGNQYGAYTRYSNHLGNGILAGNYTEILSTIVGNGPQYGTFLTNSSSGSGPHYGVRSILNDVLGTGERTGVSTTISNSGNGDHYGIDNTFSGPGSGFHTGIISRFSDGTGHLTGAWTEFSGNVGNGNQIGAYNSYFAGGDGILAGSFTDIRNTVTGNGPQYGTFSSNSSTGTGNKYGVYSEIIASAGGTHYGIYSSTPNTTGWAGYFLGRMYVSQNVGIRIDNPTFNVHIKQSSNSALLGGGVGLEHATNTDNWKIYHSGFHLSFAENGVRRAYITNGTGIYATTSDRRLKKHIIPAKDVLSKLKILSAYNYIYIDQDDSAKKTLGFMAQDVQPLFPELVETNEDGYFGLNYAGFGVLAIKAIQEQQIELEQLKKDNLELKEQQQLLEKRLLEIELKLNIH